MQVLPYIILILIVALGLFLGLFLFLRPSLAIQIQKKFYEKINWRIEPVSMVREIRNTKIMGLFLLGISLLAVVIHSCRYRLGGTYGSY